MELTDYRALLIDCDEVLVDRESGIWSALQPLLAQHKQAPERDEVLGLFRQIAQALAPRFDELGFGGSLCFAHRQLAQWLGLEASWEEGMAFARSARDWALFEDAPGALLYLRKFYRILICGDRDNADRDALCERLGIASEDLFSQASNPLSDPAWLQANDLALEHLLVVTSAAASPTAPVDLCLIRRAESAHAQPCPATVCASSLADLVALHQLSLRG